MKKLLLALLIVGLGFGAFAQTLPNIDNVKLTTKEDYRAADTLAAGVANYMLSTPSDKKNPDRLKAASFLISWMGGTPDFTFDLGQNVLQYFEKDLDLMSVYMASLTSAGLQNRSIKDTKQITLLATKKFIAYIDDPAHKANMTGKLKKLSEAEKQGQLQTFLKL